MFLKIDERLDRLRERHEALTQSVELVVHAQARHDCELDRLEQMQAKNEEAQAKNLEAERQDRRTYRSNLINSHAATISIQIHMKPRPEPVAVRLA